MKPNSHTSALAPSLLQTIIMELNALKKILGNQSSIDIDGLITKIEKLCSLANINTSYPD
jgi:hypothetical protein